MHIVIRQYKVDPAVVDDVTRRVREGFAPYISQVMPGFVEYYWIDAGDGNLISLSIFEDQAVAQASTKVAAGYVRDHLASIIGEAPNVIEGEVFVRVVAQDKQV